MTVFLLIVEFMSIRFDAPTVVIDNIVSQQECIRVQKHIVDTQSVQRSACIEVRKAR